MTRKIAIVQNDPDVLPGHVLEWTQNRGFEAKIFKAYEGAIPDNDFAGVIILGGEPNVDEEQKYPWLTQVKTFIRNWLPLKRPTFGICLGGQLLAEALGAKVYRRETPEIGWHRVQGSAGDFRTFHWHYYQFELPQGAKNLLSSESCPVQAYAYGDNLVGLQFHPETRVSDVQTYVQSSQVPTGPYVQSAHEILAEAPSACLAHRDFLFSQLDKIFSI